jgi:hypothetical protein
MRSTQRLMGQARYLKSDGYLCVSYKETGS